MFSMEESNPATVIDDGRVSLLIKAIHKKQGSISQGTEKPKDRQSDTEVLEEALRYVNSL